MWISAEPKVEVPGIQLRKLGVAPAGGNPIRIAKDHRNNALYYLLSDGDLYQLVVAAGTNSSSPLIYTVSDHGVAGVAGFDIGPDGAFYLVGNQASGNYNTATISRGDFDSGTSRRVWTVLARTEPYPLSQTPFDHIFNGIIVSPDGKEVYVNSGSRTDHGEIEATGGAFPGLREAGLTSCILRLPSHGANLQLPNDREALRSSGYLFAEGTRNTYDFRFAPNGDLFGTENGPDRDMSDELNWLREGNHYGFPWRMGGLDNPQQFPDYDPTHDLLLDAKFYAVAHGFYQNDPSFPKPTKAFTEPVVNLGPDANSFRDQADGQVKDATSLNKPVSTFTAHRSPLGLVFDEQQVLSQEYRGDAFMLSWTLGDPSGTSVAGPFLDAGSDLVQLHLVKTNDNYQTTTRRLVSGFSNPIDSEIIDNKIYVIEWDGDLGLYEVTLPLAVPLVLSASRWNAGDGFSFRVNGGARADLRLESSSNLLDWINLTDISSPALPLDFLDRDATNFTLRFYRAVSP